MQGERNNWTILASGGSDFGTHAPYYDQFSHGGLFDFSGYQINELVGREFAFGALQFRRAVTLNAHLRGGHLPRRLAGDRQRLGAPGRTSAHGVIVSGSLFLGIASKIGPVYLAYGQSEHGVSALYLYLGSSLDLLRR